MAYRTGVAPRTGLSARIELVVTDADTAEAFRSGSVPVLATPRLMALCEEASCLAIEGHLPEAAPRWPNGCNSTTWSRWASEATVWAEATLDRIEGRRLVFTLSVSEGGGLVAAGKLVRVIVDRELPRRVPPLTVSDRGSGPSTRTCRVARRGRW